MIRLYVLPRSAYRRWRTGANRCSRRRNPHVEFAPVKLMHIVADAHPASGTGK